MSRLLFPCALALLLVPGSRAAAQASPDSGTFRLYQRDLEVGRERFSRGPWVFEQSATIPLLKLRLDGRNSWDMLGRFTEFTLTLRSVPGDSLRGSYRARRQADSVRIESDLPRAPPPRFRPADFDIVLPPQSVAALAELVLRAAGRDTTWRVLLAGGDTVLPARVRFAGDSARVAFAGVEVLVTLAEGRVESLEIPAQHARAELAKAGDTLAPLGAPERPRADYSAPPGAPFTAEEVRIPVQPAVGDSFSLGCTLLLPRGARPPFPVVVTITGSGSQPRDEDLWPTLPAYRPFRQIAERLARDSIASLRCDDRGTAASTGDASNATTPDLAQDTKAQVAWLRSRPEIAPGKVVLLGHSEGGLIGPLLAAYDPRLAALVILAGPGKRGADILVDQARWPILRDTTLAEAERRTRLAAAEAAIRADSTASGAWFGWFYRYDPLPIAARVKQPTLILHGALDRQVSAGQADTLAAAIRKGGNRDVTVRVLPGLNHLFLPVLNDGSPSEYPFLRQTNIPDPVLDSLSRWLTVRLRR